MNDYQYAGKEDGTNSLPHPTVADQPSSPERPIDKALKVQTKAIEEFVKRVFVLEDQLLPVCDLVEEKNPDSIYPAESSSLNLADRINVNTDNLHRITRKLEALIGRLQI